LSGGPQMTRERLLAVPADERAAVFADIQSHFDFPVRRTQAANYSMSETYRSRLADGEVVLYGDSVFVAMPDGEELLEFGPLPRFSGPSQTEVLVGFGAVFALSAIAIAVLLRPVVSQLRAVEQTATAIAGGELSARIDHKRAIGHLAIAKAFNSMAERTETMVRAQRELLQAVSHELRTPLARIRFAAELMETAKTTEERRERLASVDDAAQQLDDLVGELLTYVRLDSKVGTIAHEPLEIEELFGELLQIYSTLYPDIDFSVDPASEAIELRCDRSGMQRAVGNLVSNAAKHAEDRVVLTASSAQGLVRIAVDDNGPGISAVDRKKVFEPFVRLEAASQRGIGLGLALVRRIALSLGGDVSVGDSPLGGARFQIDLPAETERPRAQTSATQPLTKGT